MKNLVVEFDSSTRLTVDVHNDYHVPGSFEPEAPCDIDFYGHRETDFEVVKVEVQWLLAGTPYIWVPMLDHEIDAFCDKNIDKLMLLVQDAIDDNKQGEKNVA
jgi:hypothetical protein